MNLSSLISISILSAGLACAQLPGQGTETVHSVFHVKAGHEAQYAQLSKTAWLLYKKLGLVLDKPHIVLRGNDEKGQPYFVEIFSWKSADIPEHAPAEVKAIWQQLESICEVRDGRRGIDFAEVTPIELQ